MSLGHLMIIERRRAGGVLDRNVVMVAGMLTRPEDVSFEDSV